MRWLASAYVEVVRGTPLLIQLYLIYYGLPNLGIRLNAFSAAVLGLGFNYAAYEAENYRAGIQAIPRGQMEAALALGEGEVEARQNEHAAILDGAHRGVLHARRKHGPPIGQVERDDSRQRHPHRN